MLTRRNSFPYEGNEAEGYYYVLHLPYDERPHGYLSPENVQRMPWSEEFKIDHGDLKVTLRDSSSGTDPSSACNAAFAKVIDEAIDKDIFELLHKKHSEPFAILGARYPVHLERFAGDLFGITARGAHLTVYTKTEDGMRIWVPRRSAQMFTFPNKLDTTVAGGVPAHQTPFENIIQEADEEASLPADLIQRDVRAAGVLTYMSYENGATKGKESVVVPDIIYVFDMEVSLGIELIPKDGEVKEFNLVSVDEVKESLARGEFKTNSAMVMIDFFIRHGIITSDNEKDYVEIMARMHRRLPFPISA